MMENIQDKCPSAYEYPLLIKNILKAPIAMDCQQEIVYKGTTRFTYKQFHERVGRLAAMLTAQGIKKGDTVAVMDWDSNRYLECYFAIPMIGAVLHTINVRLPPEQLIYTIDHAEDSVLLVHSDFLPILEAIKGRIDTVKKYVILQDDPVTPTGPFDFIGEYEALLKAYQPMEEFPDFDENTCATIFYTTGTTGLPKGVFFSHRQLVLHTITNTATLASIASGPNFHSQDTYMPITPMFHVHAWGIPYIATFMGVKQVYPGKYIPAILNGLIASEGVTFSHCVPTILAMLIKDPSAATVDYSKWKVIIGGAALPKTLTAAAMDKGIDIFAGYGMSETCPIMAIVRMTKKDLELPGEEQVNVKVRTGSPVGLAYMKVVDAQGKEVAADDKSAGEILVRSPWLTQAYFKDKSNSEKLWEGDGCTRRMLPRETKRVRFVSRIG